MSPPSASTRSATRWVVSDVVVCAVMRGCAYCITGLCVCICAQLHDLNPVFKKYSYEERLGRIARQLGLQVPLAVQSMYIFKQPRIGGEVCKWCDGCLIGSVCSDMKIPRLFTSAAPRWSVPVHRASGIFLVLCT